MATGELLARVPTLDSTPPALEVLLVGHPNHGGTTMVDLRGTRDWRKMSSDLRRLKCALSDRSGPSARPIAMAANGTSATIEAARFIVRFLAVFGHQRVVAYVAH
jgi:hypothetical protein